MTLIKSKEAALPINNLAEAFDVLRRHRMKLNPTKYTFSITSRKFFDFMVMKRGIEANPKKIKMVLDMKPLTSWWDNQKLVGHVASLSQFISKSAERCLSFFKVLKQMNFTWMEECQKAFDNLRRYLSSPPLLTKPNIDENYLCIWL